MNWVLLDLVVYYLVNYISLSINNVLKLFHETIDWFTVATVFTKLDLTK